VYRNQSERVSSFMFGTSSLQSAEIIEYIENIDCRQALDIVWTLAVLRFCRGWKCFKGSPIV
jgi:hypothetical protein